eukprot:scaffold223221_cov17-Prasinocladus_malaysianus.AAC.1
MNHKFKSGMKCKSLKAWDLGGQVVAANPKNQSKVCLLEGCLSFAPVTEMSEGYAREAQRQTPTGQSRRDTRGLRSSLDDSRLRLTSKCLKIK